MLHLKIKRDALESAIRNNPADSQYYWSQHLCPETGDIVSLSSTEDGDRYDILIPLPSMNPEGSGEEIDRFQEFSENPPESMRGFPDYVESDANGQDDYLSYAEDNGWETVRSDWDDWEADHCDFLISEFVNNVRTGSADGCSLSFDETFPEVNIELINKGGEV